MCIPCMWHMYVQLYEYMLFHVRLRLSLVLQNLNTKKLKFSIRIWKRSDCQSRYEKDLNALQTFTITYIYTYIDLQSLQLIFVSGFQVNLFYFIFTHIFITNNQSKCTWLVASSNLFQKFCCCMDFKNQLFMHFFIFTIYYGVIYVHTYVYIYVLKYVCVRV